MENTKDWVTTQRRDAQWKLFYPAEIFLKGQLILAVLFIFLLASLAWDIYTGEATLNKGNFKTFLLFLAAATFLGYPSYVIKRDKLPSVAVGRRFLALKCFFLPGYLLLRWEEIDTVTKAVKNPYKISLQLKDSKSHKKPGNYFMVKQADVEEIVLLAKKHLSSSSSPDSEATSPAQTENGCMPSLAEGKPRVHPFLRKLRYIIYINAILLISYTIYAVYTIVDTNTMPPHTELQESKNAAQPYRVRQ